MFWKAFFFQNLRRENNVTSKTGIYLHPDDYLFCFTFSCSPKLYLFVTILQLLKNFYINQPHGFNNIAKQQTVRHGEGGGERMNQFIYILSLVDFACTVRFNLGRIFNMHKYTIITYNNITKRNFF